MSKKLLVILVVMLLVVLSYAISLAERPLQKLAIHPDQNPLLRPDVRLQAQPWLEGLRVLPNINAQPDQKPLLRPEPEDWAHPWEEHLI